MTQHRVCNIEYDNELNKRLHARYFPSKELPPNFDPRPVSTKYTHFHTNDLPPITTEKLRDYSDYNPMYTFFPGNAKAPVKKVLQEVDTESILRNQFMALQRNDQAYYIPPLESQLYRHQSTLKDKPKPHEVQESAFPIVKPITSCQKKLAPKTFHNSTRYNLKNLV